MQTIEQKFQELLTGSLAQRPKPLTESEIAEHRVTYFAAHAHMFEKVTGMHTLPEDQIAEGLDALEAEIKTFIVGNPSPDHVADTHVADTHVADTHVGDISEEQAGSQVDPESLTTMPEEETREHTKAAMVDLAGLHKEWAQAALVDGSPADVFGATSDFVVALNARVTVYCAALRPIVGEKALADYLHLIADETATISFDVMTESQALAMQQAEGQSLH